jgi:DNA-binding protein H-NS
MARTSLKVLRRRATALQQLIAEREKEEKPGIRQLRLLIDKYNLKPEDIALAQGARRAPQRGGVKRGSKRPPKYQNPKAPHEKWAGGGSKPVWFRDAIKSGKKAEDLLVKKAKK